MVLSRRMISLTCLAVLATALGGCRDRSPAPEREPVAAPAAAAPPVTTPGEPAAAVTAAAAKAAPAVQPAAVRPSSSDVAVAKDALRVRRLVVTHAIEAREPVATEQLTLGERPVVAFVELSSSAPIEQNVVVTFEKGERAVGHIKLRVPGDSRRWRTWGQTRRIREAGTWTAVVRSESGEELARQSFVIE